MINFTVTTEGQSLLNNAVAGTSPLIIDGVAFYNGITHIKTIKSTLKGCSYNDGNGIGEYVRVSVEDRSTDTYSVTNIGLFSNSVLVAKSESFSFSKSVKRFLLDLYCVFNGASKCSFNSIMINTPYATTFRDGLLRLATEDGKHKDLTVYSAEIVDNKINDLRDLLTDGLVSWKKVEDSYLTGTLQLDHIELVDDVGNITATALISTDGKDGNITRVSLDGHLVGEVVSSQPNISNGSVVGSNKVVNESYISSLHTNTINSSSTYKLASSQAVQDYVTQAIENIPHIDPTNYLTKVEAEDTYQVKGDYLTEHQPIKTVNGNNLVGTGNVDISTGEANVIESISVNNTPQTITNKNVNITVPTKTSELTNDSGFITNSSLDLYELKTNLKEGAYVDVDETTMTSSSDNLPTSKAVATYISNQGFLTQHQSLDGVVATAQYNSSLKKIEFYNPSGTKLNTDIDATDFIKDGMVDTVEITGGNLVITFNTDAGKEDIEIPISDIFDASNYYTKTECDQTFLTSSDLVNYALKTEIPTNTSDLINDSGYITSADLTYMATTNTAQTFTAGKSYSVGALSFPFSSQPLKLELANNNTEAVFTKGDGSSVTLALGGGGSGNLVTLDTIQTITASKTFNIPANAQDPVLVVDSTGVHSDFFDGKFIVGSSSYSFGVAGSKGVDTTISSSSTNDNVPTSLSVVTYISNQGFALSSDIPTNTSDLTNDSDFITSSALDDYVKLMSPTMQTITSSLLISPNNDPIYGHRDYKIDGVAISSFPSVEFRAYRTNDTSVYTRVWLEPSNLIDESVFLGVEEIGVGDVFVVKRNLSNVWDVEGTSVASYRDLQNGSLTDGRLVTVDYMVSQIPTNTNQLINGAGFITSSSIPTNVSAFTNDAGYLTSYTETDPTVPSWAKQPNKPSYTLDEVSDGTTRKLSDYVPITRTVNSKALSSNITLNLDDISDGITRKLSDYVLASSLKEGAYVDVDETTMTSSSDNLPTSKAVATYISNQGFLTSHQSLDAQVATAQYNSTTKKIEFFNASGTKLNTDIDATDFIKDGMVDDVQVSNGKLVISFNTDAGKQDIEIPITDIFNANNYYTKTDIDNGDYENIIDGVQVNGLDLTPDSSTKKVNVQIKTINNNSLVGTGNVSLDLGDHNVIESISVNSTPQTITNKNVNITVPTKVSDLTNDAGYLTSYTETDPTVPSWAKQPNKPSYTLDEVSDGTTRKLSDYVPITRTVNSKALSSNITLNLDDISDGTNRVIPTTTSQLTNNSGYITSSDLPTNHVTTNTTQTITANKTISSSTLLYFGSSYSYIYGDAYGNINIRNSESNSVFSSILTLNAQSLVFTLLESGQSSIQPLYIQGLGSGFSRILVDTEYIFLKNNTSIAFEYNNGIYGYLEKATHTETINNVNVTIPDVGISLQGLNPESRYSRFTYSFDSLQIAYFDKSGLIIQQDRSITTPYLYSRNIGSVSNPSTKIYSNSFIVPNGTSSQFLKADGSVDSNTYLTSYTETDPTVPSWAKQPNKPSYTLDEVSDGTTRKLSDYVPITRTVNSKALSSNITLTLDDISDGTNRSIPTNTNQLTNGAGFITSSDLPTNHVTTNTAQDITGTKTIVGSDKIKYLYSSSYNTSYVYTGADSTGYTTGTRAGITTKFVINNVDKVYYKTYVVTDSSYVVTDWVTEPSVTGKWSIGTSSNTLKEIYAATFFGGFAGNIPYGVAEETSSGRWSVTVSPAPNPTLKVGNIIAVKFQTTNTYNQGLTMISVNGSGNKMIVLYGTTNVGNTIARSWPDGSVVLMMYDGTYWQILNANPAYVSNLRGDTSTQSSSVFTRDGTTTSDIVLGNQLRFFGNLQDTTLDLRSLVATILTGGDIGSISLVCVCREVGLSDLNSYFNPFIQGACLRKVRFDTTVHGTTDYWSTLDKFSIYTYDNSSDALSGTWRILNKLTNGVGYNDSVSLALAVRVL